MSIRNIQVIYASERSERAPQIAFTYMINSIQSTGKWVLHYNYIHLTFVHKQATFSYWNISIWLWLLWFLSVVNTFIIELIKAEKSVMYQWLHSNCLLSLNDYSSMNLVTFWPMYYFCVCCYFDTLVILSAFMVL